MMEDQLSINNKIMNRIIMNKCSIRLFILSLLAMVSSLSYAYKYEVDGIYYNLWDANLNWLEVTYSDFHNNSYSGDIVIPNSVDIDGKSYYVGSIGVYAFSGCEELKTVVLPENLYEIQSDAFSGSGLTSIAFPKTLRKISKDAFSGTKLSSVFIPENVTITSFAFESCPYLTSIVVDSNNSKYDSRDGCNAIIETATNTLYVGCSKTIIPNSVTSLCNSFVGCTNLKTITIPNSVTTIGNTTFVSSGIESLIIPNSVNTIGKDAFLNCKELETIAIPNSVTSIGSAAFKGCKELTQVISEIVNPYDIEESVFESISSDAILQVPKGTKQSYIQYIGWTKHFKSIVEEGEDPSQISVYTISITSTGKGSASYGGETIRGTTKTYSVNDGTSLTVNFNPDSGYRIKSLKVNGSSVSTTNSYSLTINSDTAIEVEFEEIPDTPSVTTYTLSIIASGNGSANYGGESIRGTSRSYSLNEGSSVSISFTPDEGYRIESVKVNGSNIGKERSYSTTINANTTVEVVFEAIPVTTYTLTVTASGNGVATFDGTEVRNGSHGFTVNEGSDAIISFTPDKGYKVDAVKADGNEVEVSESYTISNITSDKTLEVVFAEMDRNFSIDGVGYQIESFEDKTVTLTGVQNSITLEVSDKINFQAQDWNIIGISENALENSEDLSAIIWNPEIPFTAKVANPNLLLYVKDEAYAPAGIRNVVVSGFAKTITLTDAQSGNNFYCPSAFTTQSIIYTHNYSMKTGLNESKGWETIALPFDVQQISHSGKGEIIPFAKWNADNDSKPFWLYELTGTGFVEAEELKANTPYIISMPNNDLYPNDYQLSGRVTFSALNAEVKKSDDIQTATFGNNTFVPTFTSHNAESGYYALNVNNDFETYQGSANVGSKFILNLRRIHPFEAYMTSTSGTRSIDIFDSMTTGIRDVLDITDSQKTQKVYDLSGRLIMTGTSLESIRQELPAGVYIINNKKMIIK